ncbi:type ISP restriction/modification enzyme [Amycolatopsis sp. NPDC003865]
MLELLSRRLKCAVDAEDLVAYLTAVTAHDGFTRRFAGELTKPGIRVPLTASRNLWRAAVNMGQEVLWLHTYGERGVNPEAGRPAAAPRLEPDLERDLFSGAD